MYSKKKRESIELYTVRIRHGNGIPILYTRNTWRRKKEGKSNQWRISIVKIRKFLEQTLATPKRENKQFLMDKCRFSAAVCNEKENEQRKPTHTHLQQIVLRALVRTLVKMQVSSTRKHQQYQHQRQRQQWDAADNASGESILYTGGIPNDITSFPSLRNATVRSSIEMEKESSLGCTQHIYRYTVAFPWKYKYTAKKQPEARSETTNKNRNKIIENSI